MIKNWLTRYTLRYPRSLVYMLQASEYRVADYLSWYHKTANFHSVEVRKQLVKTMKAIALLILSWLTIFCVFVAAYYVFQYLDGLSAYVLTFVIILATPYILAYVLPVFVLLGHIIQKPLEQLALRQIKQTLERYPEDTTLIAIAGSYGKTTMREIVKEVISHGKRVAAPPSSYNTPLGIRKFIRTLTGEEEVIIFELGEYYPGDVKRLCRAINPDIGIITGINEAHLQTFKTLERTTDTIYELADCVDDEWLYVNGENRLARGRAPDRSTIYTKDGTDRWQVADPKTSLSGTSFYLETEGRKHAVTSGLLGLHQIGPLAAAADIAGRIGLSSDQIRKGIENTKPFEHRLEPKDVWDDVVLLDDSYNGNPDGVEAVILFLASLSSYRRFYVTPGLVEMGSREKEVHYEIGRQLAQTGIEKVVLIKNSVTPYIEQGLREHNYRGEVVWFDDPLHALNSLPHLTVAGDVVLVQNDLPDQYV